MNQSVVVGRLVRDPELRQTDGGSKMTWITLAVPRNYKNTEGEYESDFISCVLWKGIAENTVNYCHKGDLLAVKGRLQTRMVDQGEENKKYVMEVVAEKVSFLSPQKKED